MAHEKVSILGIRREENYLYFLRGRHVMRVAALRQGGRRPRTKVEMVKENAFQRSPDANQYVYFLDGEGDVARAPRQISIAPEEETPPPAAAPARICVFGGLPGSWEKYRKMGFPVFGSALRGPQEKKPTLEESLQELREATAVVIENYSTSMEAGDHDLFMIGAALAMGKNVYLAGLFNRWLFSHPQVHRAPSTEEALIAANGGAPPREKK